MYVITVHSSEVGFCEFLHAIRFHDLTQTANSGTISCRTCYRVEVRANHHAVGACFLSCQSPLMKETPWPSP